MISWQRLGLPRSAQRGLQAYQRSLAGIRPKNPRIKQEWSRFTADTTLRPQVLAVLEQQSFNKCVYCENEGGSTIDHFYPKRQYPGRTFQWDNLNLSCFECNLAKNRRFSLSGRRPVILNPMSDPTADYLCVDLDTGVIAPAAGLTPYRKRRAEQTIKHFKLQRTGLIEARRKMAELIEEGLQAYEAYPIPAGPLERFLLKLIDLDKPFRLVVRQMLRNPKPALAPAVQIALANPTIRAYAQTKNLI